MSFGMAVFGAGGGSDESSGDEEEGGSQGSAVDIEDMGRYERMSTVCTALLPCWSMFESGAECFVWV